MSLIWISIVAVCAIGWFNRYVNVCALIYYMKKQGYKLPDKTESKECTLYVVEHLFKN